MAEIIRLSQPKQLADEKVLRDEPAAIVSFRKKEPCPPELEWFRPVVEYQKIREYRDYIGYKIAVAKQEAQRIIASRKKP